MKDWLSVTIVGGLGVAIGLVYGWILQPAQFLDTTPASLRSDYRADYVLMVAEAYHESADGDLARRQLAVFGADPPALICAHALQTARQAGYSQTDVALIQGLMLALQAAEPVPTRGAPP
jgi:hypothetical protein